MGENVEFEDSEAEEVLSFCDLPVYNGAATAAKRWDDFSKDDDRSSSDHDFFGFFNDLSVEMSPAEDIIFCGKLIPCKEKQSYTANIDEDHSQNFSMKSNFCRRSESLNELQSSRSSVKGGLMRNSHSLDYRKLPKKSNSKTAYRVKSPAKDQKPSERCDFPASRESMSMSPAKPRWHLLLFGLVKFPQMELKDIRNRQSRRIPSSLFPAFTEAETVSLKRDEAKVSWRLLRALSCKNPASAAVTASLCCIEDV